MPHGMTLNKKINKSWKRKKAAKEDQEYRQQHLQFVRNKKPNKSLILSHSMTNHPNNYLLKKMQTHSRNLKKSLNDHSILNLKRSTRETRKRRSTNVNTASSPKLSPRSNSLKNRQRNNLREKRTMKKTSCSSIWYDSTK